MAKPTSQFENVSRRSLLRLAIGASALAFTGAAASADVLNNGFQGLNAGNGERDALNGGRIAQQLPPKRDYDRSKNPKEWARYNIPRPKEVMYAGLQAPGSLVLDHKNQLLYLVLPQGRAMEYVVVVGRQGLEISGDQHKISRKVVDPTWFDPEGKNHIFETPGPTNPLGVRGLFLADMPGREYGYIIHGTNNPKLLTEPNGTRKHSHGCIRMHNEDVMDLYDHVQRGASVHIYYKGEVAPLVRYDGKRAELGPKGGTAPA